MSKILMTSLLIIALIHQSKGVDCLRMINLHVPVYAIVGVTVVLECEYDLQSEELYMIQWYKDNSEFYVYKPTQDPPGHKYLANDIKVELNSSDDKIVTLKEIDLSSAGRYRCEVSTAEPHFNTHVAEDKEMKVAVLPTSGPEITGALLQYEINDIVNVNCTASKSKPAALLLWRINGQQAPESILHEYAVQIDADHLETSTLRLTFLVDHANHFRGTTLSLWCVATIAPIAYNDVIFDATIA